MSLKDREVIVTAYAQPASGPGWSNSPIWVVIRDGNGALREECIQPEKQTVVIQTVYNICAESHSILAGEARKILSAKNK